MQNRLSRLIPTVFITLLVALAHPVWAHPLEGRPAPKIHAKTLDGKPFDLSKVKASVIVLDFWATWCPPCRKGLPLLQRYEDWAQKNKKSVAVFAVNLREKEGKIRAFWKKQGYRMPVLIDADGQIGQSYGVTGIPQTVVIHNGKIITVHVGYSPGMADMLKSQTEQLLRKSNKK